jgi:hypothetical protein
MGLTELFYESAQNPMQREGGGREISTSLIESLDLMQEITGNSANVRFGPERERRPYLVDFKLVKGYIAFSYMES